MADDSIPGGRSWDPRDYVTNWEGDSFVERIESGDGMPKLRIAAYLGTLIFGTLLALYHGVSQFIINFTSEITGVVTTFFEELRILALRMTTGYSDDPLEPAVGPADWIAEATSNAATAILNEGAAGLPIAFTVFVAMLVLFWLIERAWGVAR